MASPVPVNTDPFPKREGPPRDAVVGGSVSGAERNAILHALAAGGFDSQSDGVRSVCLAYMKSPEIRALVEQLRKAGELE